MKVFQVILYVFCPFILQAQYSANDWIERDSWMNVPKIFELAEIPNASIVADIGCHEGYLTVRLAKKVGSYGVVYAVDVDEDRLDVLKDHLRKRKLENVQVVLGAYDNPKLPENLLDVIFIVDAYHEMYDYMEILAHCKTALKEGGRIVIIEKLKRQHRNKTRQEQTNAHTLSLKYVKSELQETGFTITKQDSDIGDWENDPDKTIWILVAEKK